MSFGLAGFIVDGCISDGWIRERASKEGVAGRGNGDGDSKGWLACVSEVLLVSQAEYSGYGPAMTSCEAVRRYAMQYTRGSRLCMILVWK